MSILTTFIILLIIFIICFKVRCYLLDNRLLKTVTSKHRGTKSEQKLILQLLKLGIPSTHIYHDLYIETHNKNYSQTDVLVISSVGIIVFEVKDYSGWIFGTGYQKKWMQILNYGKEKHQFYNPILQNEGHIKALKNCFTQQIPFYSIIVFYGNSQLKDISKIPNNTFVCYPNNISNIIKYITTQNHTFTYENMSEILQKLKNAVQNGDNTTIIQQHIRNVQQFLDS